MDVKVRCHRLGFLGYCGKRGDKFPAHEKSRGRVNYGPVFFFDYERWFK